MLLTMPLPEKTPHRAERAAAAGRSRTRVRVLALLPALMLGFACASAGQEPAPANPEASPNARRVLAFLREQQGRLILSGQEESPGQLTREEEAILAATGRRPALRGFDARFENPDPIPAAQQAWERHNQLITLSWHMGLPPDGPMADGDDTFASSKSDIDAATYDALLTPGTRRHENLREKLRRQAERLAPLARADVPILWRPFHEHEADPGRDGGWFWWSDIHGDPTRFTRLWALMFETFVREHQLNNLIWVWSANNDPLASCGGTDGRAWYVPIAGQVDILGTDVYGRSQNNERWKLCYDHLRIVAGDKPVALTENALIPLPDDMRQGDWMFSWFLTWTGKWREENDTGRLEHIYHHPLVLTADEMPRLRAP